MGHKSLESVAGNKNNTNQKKIKLKHQKLGYWEHLLEPPWGRLKQIQRLSINYSIGAKLPLLFHNSLTDAKHVPHSLLKRITENSLQACHLVLEDFQCLCIGLSFVNKGFLMLLHLSSFLLNKIIRNLILLLCILKGTLHLSHASIKSRRRAMYYHNLFQRVVNFYLFRQHNSRG